MNPIPEEIERFGRAVGPRPDPLIAELDEYAQRESFPTVGPAVGGWLQLLAGLVGAERIFEFGSGFGYSACWFARALPEDGEIVLTEVDADELDQAREFLDRGGYADIARFERGDAIEIVERYDGPFDVVLIDNEKHRYAEAFESVRAKVAQGGVIVADNAIATDRMDFPGLLALVEGDDPGEIGDHARGVAEYLERVRSDPGFETAVVPLGEGIAVSRRVA